MTTKTIHTGYDASPLSGYHWYYIETEALHTGNPFEVCCQIHNCSLFFCKGASIMSFTLRLWQGSNSSGESKSPWLPGNIRWSIIAIACLDPGRSTSTFYLHWDMNYSLHSLSYVDYYNTNSAWSRGLDELTHTIIQPRVECSFAYTTTYAGTFVAFELFCGVFRHKAIILFTRKWWIITPIYHSTWLTSQWICPFYRMYSSKKCIMGSGID